MANHVFSSIRSSEAKTVGFCIVLMLFFACILVPLNFVNSEDMDALVIVRGAGIVIKKDD